jgi:hypothetical protein
MRNYQNLHLDTNWSKERYHCCSHFTSAAVCHLYWLVCGVSTRKHNGSELFLQEQSSLYPTSHYDVSNTNPLCFLVDTPHTSQYKWHTAADVKWEQQW